MPSLWLLSNNTFRQLLSFRQQMRVDSNITLDPKRLTPQSKVFSRCTAKKQPRVSTRESVYRQVDETKLLLTLELNVTLIFSMISTKISSLFLPPGSFATTDFVTAVPGIRLFPCCIKQNSGHQDHEYVNQAIFNWNIKALVREFKSW